MECKTPTTRDYSETLPSFYRYVAPKTQQLVAWLKKLEATPTMHLHSSDIEEIQNLASQLFMAVMNFNPFQKMENRDDIWEAWLQWKECLPFAVRHAWDMNNEPATLDDALRDDARNLKARIVADDSVAKTMHMTPEEIDEYLFDNPTTRKSPLTFGALLMMYRARAIEAHRREIGG